MESTILLLKKFAAWALILLGTSVSAQDGLRLKSGRSALHTAGQAETLSPGGHFLMQFRSYPGADVRADLEKRGLKVLRYVPDSGLLVSSGESPDLEGLDLLWAGRLEVDDKISHLVRDASGNAFVVVFHSDVGPARSVELAGDNGFDILPHPSLLAGQLLVSGPAEHLVRLARHDEVAYILPASFDLVAGENVIACPGPVVEAGLVGEYVSVGTGWPRDATGTAWLNYFLLSLPSQLSQTAARGEIERAMREWERYANVRLAGGHAADAPRTIAIRFARASHGDNYPFDGPGRVLAHTFYPAPPNSETLAGDMHFDADESWGIGTGRDLYSVALHELGHALGLGHSDQPGAVMYPYYRFAAGLSTDDIAGIRKLYGEAGTAPAEPPADPPVVPPTQPPEPPAQPPSNDRKPPLISILSPGSTIVSVRTATIRLAGTAADNTGVVSVKWATSNGGSGVATGTKNWSASVPLLVGNTTVTVRAYDAAGNSGWRSLTVVRR